MLIINGSHCASTDWTSQECTVSWLIDGCHLEYASFRMPEDSNSQSCIFLLSRWPRIWHITYNAAWIWKHRFRWPERHHKENAWMLEGKLLCTLKLHKHWNLILWYLPDRTQRFPRKHMQMCLAVGDLVLAANRIAN